MVLITPTKIRSRPTSSPEGVPPSSNFGKSASSSEREWRKSWRARRSWARGGWNRERHPAPGIPHRETRRAGARAYLIDAIYHSHTQTRVKKCQGNSQGTPRERLIVLRGSL